MVSSGLSLNMVFDDRDSPIQTGFRTYAPTQLPGRGVFAVWATTWFTFGSPPYLELPAIRWDTYQRSGRGYPQGRVRGENGAAFVNLLATSDPITRGSEKVYAVGVEGAKRLFPGTGEAF
jgi:hypothetical protein